jgi:hypothetical protein
MMSYAGTKGCLAKALQIVDCSGSASSVFGLGPGPHCQIGPTSGRGVAPHLTPSLTTTVLCVGPHRMGVPYLYRK